ncbi:FAD/NAD(P)-binding protein [Streptomyces shenzhenensis]|uniref:FAD/NAD(P)-binding protein n=1 Tax=Streptomyces shenzhenensis TaxID=943815 RepID=UPI00380025E2
MTSPHPGPAASPDAGRPAVAVVGAGPRGTAVLERLLARLRADTTAAAGDGDGGADGTGPLGVDLHVIEPYVPGAGRVWAPGQPDPLLMNTLAGHATAFPDASVRMAGPPSSGPSLLEWCEEHAPGLAPHAYPARALMGRYLAWAYHRIVADPPPGVRVIHHPDRAVALAAEPGGRLRLTLAGGGGVAADAVVLATGHTEVLPGDGETALAAHAAAHGLTYVPPGQAHERELDAVPAGEPVLVRGLALNFFDQITLLTTGRGGRFVPLEQGLLRYLPSGREPRVYAGSGRGVPYLARGHAPGTMPAGHRRRVLDDGAVQRLLDRGPGSVSFADDVWPLIAKEAGLAWYEVLLRRSPGACALPPQEFLDRYAAASYRSAAEAELLAAAFADPGARFDLRDLDRPLSARQFAAREEFDAWMREHLRDDLAQALDPANSPLKAAASAVAAVKGAVRRLVAAGALTGDTRTALSWFRAFGAHLSSGPPPSRIAELLALSEAGVVSFLGARPEVRADAGREVFTAVSATVPGAPVEARALIDAWLPGADVSRTADPLLRSLLDSGLARPHRTDDGRGEPSGALDVEPSGLRVRDADGVASDRLFACGIPLEGVEWNTAIGARARSDAALFRQADIVAAQALTAARTTGADRTTPAATALLSSGRDT